MEAPARRSARSLGETLVIGLTGSIGMGKSTVSTWIEELGVPVNDADAVVHKLYASGGAAVDPIRELFGNEVLDESGGINRKELSKFLVGDSNAANMKKVEDLLFPMVDEDRDKFIQNATQRGDPLVVLDIPLLFERGHERFCDKVIVVSAPADVQRERVLARPGMVEEKFEAILKKQVPDAEKRTKADVVIDTGVALEETRAAVVDFVNGCRDRIGTERQPQGFWAWLPCCSSHGRKAEHVEGFADTTSADHTAHAPIPPSAPEPTPAHPTQKGQKAKSRSKKPLKSGALWKLNSHLEPTDRDAMKDLDNWRRRQFVFAKDKHGVKLSYYSEKDDDLDVACFLPQNASLDELAPVLLDPMVDDVRLHVQKNMHSYDLAFGEPLHFTYEGYRVELPENLYPILVRGENAESEAASLVIGAASSDDRDRWVEIFREAVPGLLDRRPSLVEC